MHDAKLACPKCTSTNVAEIVYYSPPGRAEIEEVAKGLLQDRYPPYYWTEAVQERLREERAQNLAKTEDQFKEKAAEFRRREELGEITVRTPVVDFERYDWHCNSCGNDWRRKTSAKYGEPVIEIENVSLLPCSQRSLRLYSNGRVQFEDDDGVRAYLHMVPPKRIQKEFRIPAKEAAFYAERLERAGFFDFKTVYRPNYLVHDGGLLTLRLVHGKQRKQVTWRTLDLLSPEVGAIFHELWEIGEARTRPSRFELFFDRVLLSIARHSGRKSPIS